MFLNASYYVPLRVHLVIQIPCLNEATTLPQTIRDLPIELLGVNKVTILVIDDGSTDNTAEVAKSLGAEVVSLRRNQGLAAAFQAGITRALELGADCIVNTDADNQYVGADIAKLVAPVVAGSADVVVGARPIGAISHFSPVKKVLQKLGSAVIRRLSGTTVKDAPSGFRAYSREAALRLRVFSRFSYTLETLISSGRSGLKLVNIDIRVNPKTRESRLFKSIPHYLWKSATTFTRAYVYYAPLQFFSCLSVAPLLAGGVMIARWFVLHEGQTGFRIPSLIGASVLLLFGFQLLALGVLGEISAHNRRHLEQLLYEQRKQVLARK